MTDNNLESIAYETDEFLADMLAKHKTDPLILGSIVLARLMLANEYTGSGDDFRKLASSMPTKAKNSESIH